jgi:4'-phosphopantetheinyl transferase EntD
MNEIATPWPDRCRILAGSVTLSRADGEQSRATQTSRSPRSFGDSAPQDDEWFSPAELEQAAQFKLPKRREEWLLARAAAKQLAMQLGITDDPRTLNIERPTTAGWYVSLSHSAHYGGAALAREPIGLDVQVVREIAEWATHLFLSERETGEMRTCSIGHRVLHFWCAKEAAFKRSAEYETMKQLPLRLIEERENGLLFDQAETVRIGDLIVAITPPSL